jgi:hypothetical protein
MAALEAGSEARIAFETKKSNNLAHDTSGIANEISRMLKYLSIY